MAPTRAFVLVHDAWHGGWCWRHVKDLLRQRGHIVFRPSLTGLGDRSHLLDTDIGVPRHALDIANLMRFEDLSEVVLVGHGYGGLVITAVADIAPERLRHLVYLDAFIATDGQSAVDVALPHLVTDANRVIVNHVECVAVPSVESFGVIPESPEATLLARLLVPQPLSTFTTPIHLRNKKVGNGVRRTYVSCHKPYYPLAGHSCAWAYESGWPMRRIATGHDVMLTAPEKLTDLLEELGNCAAPQK